MGKSSRAVAGALVLLALVLAGCATDRPVYRSRPGSGPGVPAWASGEVMDLTGYRY